MPFKNLICDVTGEAVDPTACLNCARDGALPGCEMTPAIVAGIVRHQRPVDFSLNAAQSEFSGGKIDRAFSVTELLGCPRKVKLQSEVDWGDKPSKLYWAYRGTLFHGEAERYGEEEPTAVSEDRLFWFFKYAGKVIALSGQPDLILYRNHAWHLLDYKTIKQVPSRTYRHTCRVHNKLIYDTPWKANGKGVNCPHCGVKHTSSEVDIEELPPQPRGSHIEQVQLYVLLIEQNNKKLTDALNIRLKAVGIDAEVPANISVDSAELHYLDMSGGKRIAIPVWSRDERVALLKQRLAAHMQDDPQPINDPQEAWQCDYCPVRAACELQNGGPVGKNTLAIVTTESN